MICPTCRAAGETSRVFILSNSTTTMGYTAYYDEGGKHHNHDANGRTSHYRCSRDHSFSETTYGSCWCGWKRVAPAPQPPAVCVHCGKPATMGYSRMGGDGVKSRTSWYCAEHMAPHTITLEGGGGGNDDPE